MKSIRLYRPFIILIVFSLFLGFFAMLNVHNHRMRFDKFHALNEGWTYETDTNVTLPKDYNTSPNQIDKIGIILPSDFEQRQTLLIRTSLQDFKVYLDGIVLYEHTHEQIGQMNSYASLWFMIEVPEHSDNKLLEIEISSPYEGMSGRFNTIYYGSDAALNTYVVRTYGIRFLIGVLVLIISFVMLILNIVVLKKIYEASALLGAFGIFLGSWILAESRLLQYFIGQSLILGSLAYLALALMPLPLVFYIRGTLVKGYKHIFNLIIGVFFINFLMINFLHITGIKDFFETVVVTQVLAAVTLLVTLLLFAYDYYKHKNESLKKVFVLILFVIVIGLLEFINFLSGNFDLTSVFVVTGIGLLMIVALILSTKDLLNRFKETYEKEMYQKLAYIDVLTGSKNRLAYEKDMESLFNSKDRNRLLLIYFDFDDLKYINDKYGHLEGDKIIIEGYKVLSDYFKPYGHIYRVGGDEFVFLGFISQTDIEDRLDGFLSFLEKKNETLQYPISISYGHAYYDEVTMSKPKDLMKKADYQMYDLKKTKKASR